MVALLADIAPVAPDPPVRVEAPDRLADRLFLLAHTVDGRPAARAIEWGLAAGLLGELALTGHLTVDEPRGTVCVHTGDGGEPTGITTDVWRLMRSEPPLCLRDWIAFSADGIRDQIGRRLLLGGFVTHEPTRRRRGAHRYPPRLSTTGLWLHDRAAAISQGREPAREPTELLLVALAHAVGLLRAGVPETAWKRLLPEARAHSMARARLEDLRVFCLYAEAAIAVLTTTRR